MNLEEKYAEMMQRFRNDSSKAIKEAVHILHCEIAPHLDTDTDANVSHQAGELIKGILGGEFDRVDETAVMVSGHSGISVLITMTTAEYDNIRKNLVDAMPACPKDLEIQSLKDQLKRAWERYYKMHADLKWLAENVSEWGGTYSFKHIFLKDGEAEADYSSEPCSLPKTFTRAQWQAAREELIIQRAAQRQRPNIKTQVTAWHAARDELISPFSSPEEEEAWKAAEERMDIIGQNGATGEHYGKPMDDNCPAARIGELGNQVHNLGCDYQNNEDLSEKLGRLAIMLWNLAKVTGENPMSDYNTATLDHYQGLVDQLKDENAALEKYRAEFVEKLMQEYTEDNHKLSWQVTEWLGEESTQIEGYLFSAMTDPDFDMTEAWRDWLTERFDALAKGMSSKEMDDFQEEYF